MESIQQLLADLFGGDVSFFSSLWDIVQGFLLVGGGIVAMIYRSRDTLSRAIAKVKTGEVDKLTQEIVTVKKGVDLEVKELRTFDQQERMQLLFGDAFNFEHARIV